jgi:S-formylglutathione hydrolase
MKDNQSTLRLVQGALTTALVPDGKVDYAVIVPVGHDAGSDPLPLLLQLHGAGGSIQQLIGEHDAGIWERRIADGVIPPMVIAMISGLRGTYLDYYDGSQRWTSFLKDEFVPFCESTFHCGGQQDMRMAMGVSMGGFGVLHLCFGQPNEWGAVAASEPAIDAALDAKDITMRSMRRAIESATQDDRLTDRHIGKFGPGTTGLVAEWDADFFRANNPVAMAADHAKAIRTSGLKICIEVGDQDNLMLHDAAELLHRILWDQRIEHSYYLHHGADHMGLSMTWRMEALCLWLGNTWRDLHLSEEQRAHRYGAPSAVEREWIKFTLGQRDMPDGEAPDWSGDRMLAIMRYGQEPAVRANYGEQTDGPDYLEGFKWRSGGKD